MRELLQIPSSSTSKKQKREYQRINELPDEALILILSHMPMKEAARTSVLSRQWEKLCTSHPCLVFDGSKKLLNFQYQIRDLRNDDYRGKVILDSERVKYIYWVNHILQSHHASTIDEFKIRFDLNECYQSDIDEWVRFAFGKEVQRFELDLSNYQGFIHIKDFCYKKCIQTLGLQSPISLTTLVLKQVNLTWLDSNMTRKVKKKVKSQHYNLKVVEITGVVGRRVDTEFCSYLIKSAILLEKMSIDPLTSYLKGTAYVDCEPERVRAAREQAEHIRSKYGLEDKLVIVID